MASASIVGAVNRSATASWTRNFFRIALMSWRERRRSSEGGREAECRVR